jgi:hypothetical protein
MFPSLKLHILSPDRDTDEIAIDGTTIFCEDLNVNPKDVRCSACSCVRAEVTRDWSVPEGGLGRRVEEASMRLDSQDKGSTGAVD